MDGRILFWNFWLSFYKIEEDGLKSLPRTLFLSTICFSKKPPFYEKINCRNSCTPVLGISRNISFCSCQSWCASAMKKWPKMEIRFYFITSNHKTKLNWTVWKLNILSLESERDRRIKLMVNFALWNHGAYNWGMVECSVNAIFCRSVYSVYTSLSLH